MTLGSNVIHSVLNLRVWINLSDSEKITFVFKPGWLGLIPVLPLEINSLITCHPLWASVPSSVNQECSIHFADNYEEERFMKATARTPGIR